VRRTLDLKVKDPKLKSKNPRQNPSFLQIFIDKRFGAI
jgi:hypothetical protein